jgi:glycoside/pentoside/hexuronide:cation symporter, GPH family
VKVKMDLKQHHITDKEDRPPFIQKAGYGIGAIVTIVAVNSLMQLTGLFYIDLLKISPIIMGFAAAIPRGLDAILDPIMGNISDNTRSRFGRRIPYILIGGILVGITFALLFMVPRDWSKDVIFAYFLVTSLIFYTAVTIYAVPHGALGLEMTNDYHERTRIFAYASFIGNVGAIASPWLYYFANRSVFKDAIEGMKWVCVGLGLILIISAIICAVTCKEHKLKQAKKQKRVKFWESFKITCKNRTFMMLVVVFVLVITGFQFVMGFSNFIMMYYVYSGDKAAASGMMGWMGTIWAVTGIIGIFPMIWISSRLGKTNTVIFSFAIITVGQLLKIVCYNQTYPWLAIIPTILLSWGMVMCFTLVNAMNADICDEDELITGKRREGSYYAVYGWWWKVAVSIACVISGYLLKITGYNADFAQQTDSTMFWLRFCEIGLPAALCVVAIVILTRYPLTENRAYEIKDLLAKRRLAAVGEENRN